MINTKQLIKAALELAAERDTQYAEDCVKGLLIQKKITVEQYSAVFEALYQ